jgi:hypothetical protein
LRPGQELRFVQEGTFGEEQPFARDTSVPGRAYAQMGQQQQQQPTPVPNQQDHIYQHQPNWGPATAAPSPFEDRPGPSNNMGFFASSSAFPAQPYLVPNSQGYAYIPRAGDEALVYGASGLHPPTTQQQQTYFHGHLATNPGDFPNMGDLSFEGEDNEGWNDWTLEGGDHTDGRG